MISHYEGISLQTKYLIGFVIVISILVASFAGFGLAHFEYQPQIESMKNQLSQLNSTVTSLRSNVNALEANYSSVRSENKVLNGTVTELSSNVSSLRSNLSALETNYTILQFENLALNETIKALNSSVDGLRLNVSALKTDYGTLQHENAVLLGTVTELNSSVDSLQSSVNALEANCSILQSQIAVLNETVRKLTNYIDNISFATDSSYYIFKQNSTYYAKSGFTGEIEFHNESCSQVINYALAYVLYGGAVLFEPLTSANDAYYIDSTIYPPSGVTLASENRMVTICLDNNSAVQTVVDLHNVSNVQISNIRIDGNKGNNATGCGIIIDSNYSYASDHLIENVVIDDCSGTGIWITQYPANNVVENVQVLHSGVYNIEVDSADNKLTSVESGWAGLSGFDARGEDNYFLNCISYGCGQMLDNDGNGFFITGARNMFVGCDAGANFQGGFVLANANQSMFESCVGRDNGQTNSPARIPGRWGFDLWNSHSTIISGCLSTDENVNKTQDYGFTEGGNSDYNIVIGCNFEGNNVGAVFDLVGIHSVIIDTLGYETENFGLSNFSVYKTIAVGTNGIFGEATNFTSSKETITDFHVTIGWDNVSSNENVTVRVQAFMANGTTTSFQTFRNDNGTYILTEEDLSGLWSKESSSNPFVQLQISAETTENATAAAVSVFVWGSGS